MAPAEPSRSVTGHAPRSASESLGSGPSAGQDRGDQAQIRVAFLLPCPTSLSLLGQVSSTSLVLSSAPSGREAPAPLLCIPHPVIGFPSISSALIPGTSKPEAGGGEYFRNLRTGLCNCAPSLQTGELCTFSPSTSRISASPGVWAPGLWSLRRGMFCSSPQWANSL